MVPATSQIRELADEPGYAFLRCGRCRRLAQFLRPLQPSFTNAREYWKPISFVTGLSTFSDDACYQIGN